MVRVKDSGSGIKPDVLPRIFVPFYTTKPKEQNSGLGLTVCLAILQEHEGRVEVDSTEERGTCVTLFLPDKVKPTVAATSNMSKVLAGKKILVAEDEPALAQLLSTLLTPEGSSGSCQRRTQSACVGTARPVGSDYHDIQMPGISGIELYQRLASSNPELANPGSTRAEPERLRQDAKAHFLYKPFSRSELIDAISRVFAEWPRAEQSN